MNFKRFLLTTTAAGVVAIAAISGAANAAPMNQPPPIGNIVDQLTGLPITGTYATRTVDFVATAPATNLAFAIREDPAFINLANVSVTDLTHPGGNLVVNGSFAGGTYAGPPGSRGPQPVGWTYLNTFGASFGGEVQSGCGPTGGFCYDDGAVQAYDGINQLITTSVGDTYQLSYAYTDTDPAAFGGGQFYQPVSTNGDVTDTGGNGRDLFAYAGATVPVRAPEPASLAVLGAALAGFGWIRRRRA